MMRLSIGIRLETVGFIFYLSPDGIRSCSNDGCADGLVGGDAGRRRQQAEVLQEPLSAKIMKIRKLGMLFL